VSDTTGAADRELIITGGAGGLGAQIVDRALAVGPLDGRPDPFVRAAAWRLEP
jgi:NAD(P)-dependent dehydrogenase (short-subunit alcohol dehydrogenase family)